MTGDRISMPRAAMIIARRDFTAILFSRAFFFFLLGPLFPLAIGAIAGNIGRHVESAAAAPQIGLAMPAGDISRMVAAHDTLAEQLGESLPDLVVLKRLAPGEAFDARAMLDRRQGNLAAVLTGTSVAPTLTATRERLAFWTGPVALIAASANRSAPTVLPQVRTAEVAATGASDERARMHTAQAGQLLMFLLTILLGGMVLSTLVEEKANKIIEILAAAIPMDAVFLGKLIAMLGISLVGIAVWATVIGGMLGLHGFEILFGNQVSLSDLPEPGVGWPLFFFLGFVYFALAYLLLGSILLAVGSLATTVREVQTLSMPVTMGQMFLFLFATLAVNEHGGWLQWAAMAFPFSSPYAMLAHAAQARELWPHALAIAWQMLWVGLSIRFGSAIFRKRVMQSGPRKPKKASRAERRAATAEVATGRAAS